MEYGKIIQLLSRMGIEQVSGITQFRNPEDGEGYAVWCIDTPQNTYVLKRAKGYERETYEAFFRKSSVYAPQLIDSREEDGEEYLLLEYIAGQNLMHCTKDALIRTIDVLSAMQIEWWHNSNKNDVGQSFKRSLTGRKNRLNFLNDPVLERTYEAYLGAYRAVPRTLCHDDLLPFNILIAGDRAVFIDWEYGGILPYLSSIARLLAHCEDKDDAFFYMREEDRLFAIDYYYNKCAKVMGISRKSYENDLELFLFYEYCEWIYLGNKHGDTKNERYRRYHRLAVRIAQRKYPVNE